jgi:hypothetical protein
MTTTTTTPELTNAAGRWLGSRGILRHYVPGINVVNLKAFDRGVAFHTVVTAVAGEVVGELIRSVSKDRHKELRADYEVRINGLDESYGICDVAAYTIDSLADLAKDADDLRYEWEIITGVYEGTTWSVW